MEKLRFYPREDSKELSQDRMHLRDESESDLQTLSPDTATRKTRKQKKGGFLVLNFNSAPTKGEPILRQTGKIAFPHF